MSTFPPSSCGTILVTGAGGFIGSHLVARLASEGHELRCVHHPSDVGTGVAGCERRDGDIRNPGFVQAAMEGVSCVFHLAAMVSVGSAQAAPQDAFAVNTSGVQNILEAARMAGTTKVVLLSTAHVYGKPASLPVTEQHRYAPGSVYAATKLAGDMLALGYHRSFGIPVTILRPFNIYGPRQAPVAVIAEMIQQAVAGRRIQVRDTRPRRDFLFVDDVVDALMLSAASDATAGEEILLGSGGAVSIGDVAARIERIVAGSGDGGAAEDAPSDDDTLFADIGKARAVLGWTPRTDLDTGLARTLAWWRAQTAAADVHGGAGGRR